MGFRFYPVVTRLNMSSDSKQTNLINVCGIKKNIKNFQALSQDI